MSTRLFLFFSEKILAAATKSACSRKKINTIYKQSFFPACSDTPHYIVMDHYPAFRLLACCLE